MQSLRAKAKAGMLSQIFPILASRFSVGASLGSMPRIRLLVRSSVTPALLRPVLRATSASDNFPSKATSSGSQGLLYLVALIPYFFLSLAIVERCTPASLAITVSATLPSRAKSSLLQSLFSGLPSLTGFFGASCVLCPTTGRIPRYRLAAATLSVVVPRTSATALSGNTPSKATCSSPQTSAGAMPKACRFFPTVLLDRPNSPAITRSDDLPNLSSIWGVQTVPPVQFLTRICLQNDGIPRFFRSAATERLLSPNISANL